MASLVYTPHKQREIYRIDFGRVWCDVSSRTCLAGLSEFWTRPATLPTVNDAEHAGSSFGACSDPALARPTRVRLRGTLRQNLSGLTGSMHSFDQVDGSLCMQLGSGLCLLVKSVDGRLGYSARQRLLPALQIGQMPVRGEVSAFKKPDTGRQPVFLVRLNNASGCVRGKTRKPTKHTQTNNQDAHTSH